MMRTTAAIKNSRWLWLAALVVLLPTLGCGIDGPAPPPTESSPLAPGAGGQNEPPVVIVVDEGFDGQPVATPPPTDAPASSPTTATPPPPLPSPIPADTPQPFNFNLPEAYLIAASGLYASPNRGDFVVPVEIGAGQRLHVMGRNATSSHLRVVYNNAVGWVPISFTDYNGQSAKLRPLPVFEHEPPQCAVPIAAQQSLTSQYTLAEDSRIAVVVDLFRTRYGDFPRSHLALVVNGVLVGDSQREIVERGQFSLKDVVLTVDRRLQSGDVVGYRLDTPSDEPLAFMAVIFRVPNNCNWDAG